MYADLHCHATAKPFLSAIDPEKKISPWPYYGGSVPQLFYPIIGAQSCLDQLHKGEVNLAVISIVPFEKPLANFWMIRDIVSTFTILDRPTIQQINQGKISYNQLFWQEADYLLHHQKYKNKQLNILRSVEDLKPGQNIINTIIAIEGSHVLFNENNRPDNPLKRLRQIKKAEKFSVLYLTMTHLSRNEYCNHAQGMKISKDTIFNPSLQTKGLHETGLAIIEECYNRKNGKRILIDIKHMSLYSRLQFYQFRKDKSFEDIPIIASHVGITGFSYTEIGQKLKSKTFDTSSSLISLKYKLNEVSFNPLSINLYDEEILEVIRSGGLLGLSLDQRILGQVGNNVTELIREDELDELMKLENNIAPVANESIKVDKKDKTGLRSLCLHILHIVNLAGEKGWQHICLGSDFDGLIHPIDCCKTAAKLPQLEKLLLQELKDMMESSNTKIPCQNIEQHVRDFMYNNMMNFTQKYFTRQYLSG